MQIQNRHPSATIGSTCERFWYVRSRPEDLVDVKELYGSNPTLFSLKINHGGNFTKFPDRRYVNGQVSYVDLVDEDEFSVHEVNAMMEALGYPKNEIMFYHFRIPDQDLNFGLRALANDSDVRVFLKFIGVSKLMDLYIEHRKTDVIEHDEGELFSELDGVVTQIDQSFSQTKHLVTHSEVGDDVGEGELGDDEYEGFDLVDVYLRDEEGEHDDNGTDDDSEDSDYIVDEENIIDEVEVDMEDFRTFVDININEEPFEQDPVEVDMEVDLDDFDSLTDEENDTPLKKAIRTQRKKMKVDRDSVANPFYVGQTFSQREEIRKLVKTLAVESRRQLLITRNDPVRFRVECEGLNPSFEGNVKSHIASGSSSSKKVGGVKGKRGRNKITCPWKLHVSNINKEGTWMVKTFINEHRCLHTREVRLCTVSWLAKEVEHTVFINPNIPLQALLEQLQQKFQIQFSRQKVFRAKCMAKAKIEGDYRAQYGVLRDYSEELIRSNPGTRVTIDCEREPNPTTETRQFRRIYVCLGALKAGFLESGRRILGLDGSFMKGPFPGQVLTAVGIDANSSIYPVAYALVEAENKNAWVWFLENLGEDLDLDSRSYFTFISDRQKGIIPALQQVFPHAEHRYCLRHIHENMKANWRGQLYKDLLYRCATATTVPYFEKSMKEVYEKDPELHKWLTQIPAKHWSRSHFTDRAKSDVLLNNLCEVFNRQLIGGRDKPIITCLEFIREYLMKRIAAVRMSIAKCQGPLTPNATITFEKIKAEANDCAVIWNGKDMYQVTSRSKEQYVVKFSEKSCTCRRWDITAMPCKHAVAVMYNMSQHGIDVDIPEAYVSKVYWLETWKKVYSNTINPINGKDMWPQSACPTMLLPPKHHKQIGRPKKKRTKTAEELTQPLARQGKMVRLGGTVTCAKCGNKGHNQRSCKGQGGRSSGTQGAQDGSSVA